MCINGLVCVYYMCTMWACLTPSTYGYARVSTDDQNLDLQRDALSRSGCERIFEEKESGRAGTKRPALEAAIAYLRPEDQLVV